MRHDPDRSKVLVLAAMAEGATGLALVLSPSLVGDLLLGQPLLGLSSTVARVAGIALVGLAVACWPGPAWLGMLSYGSMVAVFLSYVGTVEGLSGALLWPAVGIHALISLALIWHIDWRQGGDR